MQQKRKQPQSKKQPNNQFLNKEDPILRRFLQDISKYPVLPNCEVVNLINRVRTEHSQLCRKKVLESNYRLLVRIAKDFQTKNIDIKDLIQEGFIGLDHAIDKFDVSKGVPFAHFASWWIRMYIFRSIAKNKNIVRLPECRQYSARKLLKISEKYLVDYGVFPSEEVLQDLSGMAKDVVHDYYMAYSFQNDDDIVKDFQLEDYNIANKVENIDEEADTLNRAIDEPIIAKAISKCIDTLQPKHQEFLRSYYGIGRPKITVSNMAKKYGVGIENIRQKRVRLVSYLRKNCTAMLIPYIDF